jgi:hypothetical protein
MDYLSPIFFSCLRETPSLFLHWQSVKIVISGDKSLADHQATVERLTEAVGTDEAVSIVEQARSLHNFCEARVVSHRVKERIVSQVVCLRVPFICKST